MRYALGVVMLVAGCCQAADGPALTLSLHAGWRTEAAASAPGTMVDDPRLQPWLAHLRRQLALYGDELYGLPIADLIWQTHGVHAHVWEPQAANSERTFALLIDAGAAAPRTWQSITAPMVAMGLASDAAIGPFTGFDTEADLLILRHGSSLLVGMETAASVIVSAPAITEPGLHFNADLQRLRAVAERFARIDPATWAWCEPLLRDHGPISLDLTLTADATGWRSQGRLEGLGDAGLGAVDPELSALLGESALVEAGLALPPEAWTCLLTQACAVAPTEALHRLQEALCGDAVLRLDRIAPLPTGIAAWRLHADSPLDAALSELAAALDWTPATTPLGQAAWMHVSPLGACWCAVGHDRLVIGNDVDLVDTWLVAQPAVGDHPGGAGWISVDTPRILQALLPLAALALLEPQPLSEDPRELLSTLAAVADNALRSNPAAAIPPRFATVLGLAIAQDFGDAEHWNRQLARLFPGDDLEAVLALDLAVYGALPADATHLDADAVVLLRLGDGWHGAVGDIRFGPLTAEELGPLLDRRPLVWGPPAAELPVLPDPELLILDQCWMPETATLVHHLPRWHGVLQADRTGLGFRETGLPVGGLALMAATWQLWHSAPDFERLAQLAERKHERTEIAVRHPEIFAALRALGTALRQARADRPDRTVPPSAADLLDYGLDPAAVGALFPDLAAPVTREHLATLPWSAANTIVLTWPLEPGSIAALNQLGETLVRPAP